MATDPYFRFSERSCARFIPVLKKLLTERPDVVVVNCAELSLRSTTVAGRLRDAVLAYTTGRLPCPFSEQLKEVWKDYMVVHNGELEVQIKRKKQAQLQTVAPSSDGFVKVKAPDSRVLNALLVLISEKVIPNATIYGIPVEALENSVASSDILIEPNPDGSFTLC